MQVIISMDEYQQMKDELEDAKNEIKDLKETLDCFIRSKKIEKNENSYMMYY